MTFTSGEKQRMRDVLRDRVCAYLRDIANRLDRYRSHESIHGAVTDTHAATLLEHLCHDLNLIDRLS